MRPRLSYTIWFTQRVGSTLLSSAMASTGSAGNPQELLNVEHRDELFARYKISTPADLQATLWRIGSTENGVFGLKFSQYEPHLSNVLDMLSQFPDAPTDLASRVALWENAFPNHRHIFMTRRNKVRLAVSWWRAIQSGDWHRGAGQAAMAADLSEAYNFDAINHLMAEAAMREAGIQEFFAEAGIVPLTVVYEDFISEYEPTVRRALAWLGLDSDGVSLVPPAFDRIADATSEAWVQRFREECQSGWTNRGW